MANDEVKHGIDLLATGTDEMTSVLVNASKALALFTANAKKAATASDSLKSPDLTSLEKTLPTKAPKDNTENILKAQKKKASTLSDNMKKIAGDATVVGGVLTAVFGKTIKDSLQFSNAISEVSTLVDTSVTSLDSLRAMTIELASEMNQLPIDTAKSLYTTISAGFSDAAQATQVLRQAMKLARGGVTSTEIAVDGLTSILNSYGFASDKSSMVTDKLFVAMKAGKTTIAELSANLGKATPLAANFGVSLDEVLAATSALTLGGTNTAEALTQVRAILSSISKQEKGALDVAKKLGIEFSIAGLKAKGFSGFLQDVKEKAGDDEQALSDLFGRVEAKSAIFALSGKQFESFNRILRDMGMAAGETEKAYIKMTDSAAERTRALSANITTLSTSIGTQLEPFVKTVASALSGLVKGITEWISVHPEASTVILTTTALMGGLAVAVGITAGAAWVLNAAITFLGVAFWPVTLAIFAVGGAIAILASLWYNHSEDILYRAGFFLGMWEGFWSDVELVVNHVGDTIGDVFTKISDMWDNFNPLESLGGYANVLNNFYDFLGGRMSLSDIFKVGNDRGLTKGIKEQLTSEMEDIEPSFSFDPNAKTATKVLESAKPILVKEKTPKKVDVFASKKKENVTSSAAVSTRQMQSGNSSSGKNVEFKVNITMNGKFAENEDTLKNAMVKLFQQAILEAG